MKQNWSKILLYIFILLTMLSITATAYRYLVLRDYEVYDDTEEYEDEELEDEVF